MSDQEQEEIRVTLYDVRASFLDTLFIKDYFSNEDASDPKKKKSYRATALINPETQADQVQKVKAAMKECAEGKWGVGKIPKDVIFCLKDGNKKEYDGYEDMLYIGAGNTVKPHVVGRDGRTPVGEEEGIIYAGCQINFSFRLWAQSNKWGKKVNASLIGVQFVRDGDAFGAKQPDVADVFEDQSGDETNAEEADFLS